MGILLPPVVSRRMDVGSIIGLNCRFLLTVQPPGKLDLDWMLVWRAGAVPLKNLLHTCWYPSIFGVKDAVIYPNPVLL